MNVGSGPQAGNNRAAFLQGGWVNVPINVAAGGTVTITVTRTAGPNAVLGGVLDRKSVVQGKRVDLGGRRIIKKKKSRLSWGASREARPYKTQRCPCGSADRTQVANGA